jgi:MFS superfamily sulfate permease-like transporter
VAAFGVALGLIASQAGHLLAYEVRYGAAAEQIQAAGAHAYFPTLVKIALGLFAAFVLLGLVAIGLARLLAGKRLEGAYAPSLLRVTAMLFCFQLACFVVQESAEMAAGAPVASAPALLLWGTVGQLPVALVAALVLRWLAVRVAPAVAELLAPAAPAILFVPQHIQPVVWPTPATVPAFVDRYIRAFTRRGPPL